MELDNNPPHSLKNGLLVFNIRLKEDGINGGYPFLEVGISLPYEPYYPPLNGAISGGIV
jgi:hypothetical protein